MQHNAHTMVWVVLKWQCLRCSNSHVSMHHISHFTAQRLEQFLETSIHSSPFLSTPAMVVNQSRSKPRIQVSDCFKISSIATLVTSRKHQQNIVTDCTNQVQSLYLVDVLCIEFCSELM